MTSTVSERAVMVAFIVQNDGGFNVTVVNANGSTSSPSVAALTDYGGRPPAYLHRRSVS